MGPSPSLNQPQQSATAKPIPRRAVPTTGPGTMSNSSTNKTGGNNQKASDNTSALDHEMDKVRLSENSRVMYAGDRTRMHDAEFAKNSSFGGGNARNDTLQKFFGETNPVPDSVSEGSNQSKGC